MFSFFKKPLRKQRPKFHLSQKSLGKLKGVHPKLVKVVKRAIEITDEDFTVGEGVRSKARQRQLVAKGASKTMNSKHLIQKDGYSHAVDLFWYKGGKVSWDTDNVEAFYSLDPNKEYEGYQEIGYAMLTAAKELGVKVRWGADWDMDGQHTDHKFLDWVHFEVRGVK